MDDESRSLEGVLDRLVDSYASDKEINSLDTWALPNRRAVIQGFVHLQHLFFLGYFSTRKLEKQNLRMALAEHLMPAQEILCEQIHRAAMWQDRHKEPGQQREESWCSDTVYHLLESLPELRRQLHGDVVAAFTNDPAAQSVEEVVFSYPGILALTAHRVANLLFRQGVPMIPRILSEFAHTRTGIDIHPGATIGERCFIDHGTGVVIGATTQIGNDAKIYQGVTLGALSVKPESNRILPAKRHPTLEDRVTVYAGTTILGGDTVVGADSIIGGNVWLMASVPPGSKIYRRQTEEQ